MIRYKKNILQTLKEAGVTTYRLQKDKLISAGTVQKIREGNASITSETLNVICSILECQPGDVLEWVPDEKKEP